MCQIRGSVRKVTGASDDSGLPTCDDAAPGPHRVDTVSSLGLLILRDSLPNACCTPLAKSVLDPYGVLPRASECMPTCPRSRSLPLAAILLGTDAYTETVLPFARASTGLHSASSDLNHAARDRTASSAIAGLDSLASAASAFGGVDPTLNMSTPVARSFLDDDVDPLKSPARPETAPRVARDEPDALVSPLGGPSPSPLSFKRKPQPARRTASSASAVRDKAVSFIGGILRHGSAGQTDHEAASASPAFRRVDARPQHITLANNTVKHKPSLSEFSQAVASDDELEEEDEGETTAGESPQRRISSATRGDEADRNRQRRLSASNKRAVSKTGSAMIIGQRLRRPTGSAMYGSPVKEPGALSPLWADPAYGDGDDDRPSDETLFGPDVGPLEVTPLPKIPIFVLSICMLGEFLSASVCSPFLFLYVTRPASLIDRSIQV